jgi:hypothetical protein
MMKEIDIEEQQTTSPDTQTRRASCYPKHPIVSQVYWIKTPTKRASCYPKHSTVSEVYGIKTKKIPT